MDGLSTKDEVSVISGRGVGLGAARAEVRRLGGDVRVYSQVGQGTRFLFAVPVDCWVRATSSRASRSRPPEDGVAAA